MQLFVFYWRFIWRLCFLSSFHLFFLPTAWAVDLAVQGCKYHWTLSAPFSPFMLHPFSCWGICCMKDLGPSPPPPHFNTPLSNVDLICSFLLDWCHSPVDRTLVIKVTNNKATVTLRLFSYIYRTVNALHTHGKMNSVCVFRAVLVALWCF